MVIGQNNYDAVVNNLSTTKHQDPQKAKQTAEALEKTCFAKMIKNLFPKSEDSEETSNAYGYYHDMLVDAIVESGGHKCLNLTKHFEKALLKQNSLDNSNQEGKKCLTVL